MRDSCYLIDLQNRIKRGAENSHFAVDAIQQHDLKTALRDVDRAIDVLRVAKYQIEAINNQA
jgi:hypothetical protein